LPIERFVALSRFTSSRSFASSLLAEAAAEAGADEPVTDENMPPVGAEDPLPAEDVRVWKGGIDEEALTALFARGCGAEGSSGPSVATAAMVLPVATTVFCITKKLFQKKKALASIFFHSSIPKLDKQKLTLISDPIFPINDVAVDCAGGGGLLEMVGSLETAAPADLGIGGETLTASSKSVLLPP
jgi:hypothetical protein